MDLPNCIIQWESGKKNHEKPLRWAAILKNGSHLVFLLG
jgi:hypothetical protein